MTATAAKRMTVDEFNSWVATQDDGRYELYEGEIFAMSPERAAHVKTKANVWRALADAISSAKLPCQAFVDGLGFRIDDRTTYKPDALVTCGEPVAEDALEVSSPVVVVEVPSPPHYGVDTSIKLSGYFCLPSVMHYLIVDTQRRLVIHYRRTGAEIALALVKDGAIALDPPGISFKTGDIFG